MLVRVKNWPQKGFAGKIVPVFLSCWFPFGKTQLNNTGTRRRKTKKTSKTAAGRLGFQVTRSWNSFAPLKDHAGEAIFSAARRALGGRLEKAVPKGPKNLFEVFGGASYDSGLGLGEICKM